MREVKVIVPGQPVSQARPRVTRWGTYDPPKSKAYKKLIVACCKAQANEFPLDKPLEINVKIYKAIQKSATKSKYSQKLTGAILPTKKPDLDNYIKGIFDGLSQANIWTDDNLVCNMIATKRYSDNPRAEIVIKELDLEADK